MSDYATRRPPSGRGLSSSIWPSSLSHPSSSSQPLHYGGAGYSSVRATSEFSSDLFGRRYGFPEYRTSNIEIRHTSPFPTESGSYIPRTTRRTISVTSLDSRNSVPLRLHGSEGDKGRLFSDIKYAYPSTSRESVSRSLRSSRASTPRGNITRISDSPRGYSMHRLNLNTNIIVLVVIFKNILLRFGGAFTTITSWQFLWCAL
ncbi:uncharacterized protein LOC111716197 [Eurytemora carolleeae]|uniref:uncharacterized protein LOC111716197 n=1 Tax=Eurytemora carolleeae TaxID=1294199 RepID=UPI000C759D4F|nr:uncharacterized protein LOC111716197 [Eurytemora carolleeae]|eukprot:XP_023347400.1 uncharacterized protein LOC111716197 [Eurytemora affinis]